ncbi:MAG: damage-control phosphatase ARMT1 family protein, partial [Lachnospiraceae bacterium]|nr:damage-control phosphatase ARMT1 family protein [Lachnospiraceae bacterium]
MSKKGKHAKYFFAEPHDGKNHENESFARFTVENRFPKIFREHCSGDYETNFLNKSIYNALMVGTLDDSDSRGLFTEFELDRFLYTVNEKIRHPYRDCSVLSEKKLHKKNNDDRLKKSSTLKEFFDYAPFFESEILFYHALLAQKKYFSNHYDFFATEKKDSLVNGQEKFIYNLDLLFASKPQKNLDRSIFRGSIQYCLSANTSDLSQLNAKERFNYEVGDIRIMYDDTDVLYEYLSANKKFKRFDIICDNAGKELFSDLYLACYFLHNKIVDKVVFHLKPYPFFVSDATKEDFGFMINAVTQHGGSESAHQCKEYICERKIEIEDNKFWASPLCFKDMPKTKLYKKLYKQLCDSDLIIVKGDLNYRRLVEDRDWNYTDSFAKRTQTVFGRAPIFAPRVIKSDVLIGISEAAYETARSSDKHSAPADQRFKGSGKWAVVHFRCD